MIIIAVVVGGMITSFCLTIVIYMIVKSVKKRKEDARKDRENREHENLRESPRNEIEEQLYARSDSKLKRNNKRSEVPVEAMGMDIEQLDQYINQN